MPSIPLLADGARLIRVSRKRRNDWIDGESSRFSFGERRPVASWCEFSPELSRSLFNSPFWLTTSLGSVHEITPVSQQVFPTKVG